MKMDLFRRNKVSGAGLEPQHRSPLRSSRQHAGKRKYNELVSSGELSNQANRSPAPSGGSAPLPARVSAVTSELAAACSRQLGPPEGRAKYAPVWVVPVTMFQKSRHGLGHVRNGCLV